MAPLYYFKQLLIVSLLFKGYMFQKQSIPEHLLECYKEGVLLLPMTMEVFLEIIRKIEMSAYFLMDIRTFTNTLFHRFSRDGIEKDRDFVILNDNVIPFTTTGFQSFKYQLLSYYLLPKSYKRLSDDILTLEERCSLHFMLSSSVEIWERGDEYQACSESFKSQNTSILINGRRKSPCPIEKGVVETRGFGTVSLNHIISGIATALQPLQIHQNQIFQEQTVSNFSENNIYIDNRWVSTFTGDLAEILIIQKPFTNENYFFGPGGKWNDSRLPINYYLTGNPGVVYKELWQFTDAEIMGAIDGMRLAKEATAWSQSRRILRLSQLLELYYTDKYKSHLNILHACKRNLFMNDITKNVNVLVEQVKSFSYAMANYMPNYINKKSIIKSESEKLVKQFISYTSFSLRNQGNCPPEIHTKMKIKLNVIYDNTWTHYETLSFLLNLAERIDLSNYGSAMTVIAGDIGNVIVKDTNSIGDLFLNWKTYVHDTGTMSLPDSLVKLNKLLLNNSSVTERNEWYCYITLILARSTGLTSNDISDSITMLNSIRQLNPDMMFVYVTSTPLANMYVKLTSTPGSQNDKIITSDVNSFHQILEQLDGLHFNPIAIMPLPCINKTIHSSDIEMNEYVRPHSENFYRIHPQYLCKVSKGISIKLQNGNYGSLKACIARDYAGKDVKQCQETSLNGLILFDIRNPCRSKKIYGEHQTWNENCKPIYIRISAKQSLSLCTENECRTPHDVQFKITIEGLKCSAEKNNLCNGNENILFTLVNLLLISSLTVHFLIC